MDLNLLILMCQVVAGRDLPQHEAEFDRAYEEMLDLVFGERDFVEWSEGPAPF